MRGSVKMNNIVEENKLAWEHKVYEWRTDFQGSPEVVAKDIICNPEKFLRFHFGLFENLNDKKVASICGSDGRRAVALAVLGAESTVFDVSEPQKRYALELAKAAKVEINYELGDFCVQNNNIYFKRFDYAYAEGGILHYFHDLPIFFRKVYSILKDDGVFIMSDYHPFQKTCNVNKPKRNVELTEGNYFDTRVHTGHVPYFKYFSEEDKINFPNCKLRFYTLSEIFNTMINEGFIIKSFYEHPKKNNPKIPFEYTIVARKFLN